MAFQEVVVFGHTGSVGGELVRQIVRLDGPDRGHENPTRIVGLANTSGYVVHNGGLIREQDRSGEPLEDLIDRKRFRQLIDDAGQSRFVPYENGAASPGGLKDRFRQVVRAVQQEGLRGEVVYVDATSEGASDDTGDWAAMHAEVLRSGDKLVTANKNPLALTGFDTFRQLINDRHRYAFNATALAGGDAVRWLCEAKHLNEKVYEVSGCFSGALGFIASELHKKNGRGPRPFSDIVREAVEGGYTEPVPQDDFSGLDVARKLVILVRSLGCDVTAKDVDVQGFIEEDYRDRALGVDGFLKQLRVYDAVMAAKVENAEAKGRVLRYVASFRSESGLHAGNLTPDSIGVELKAVPRDSEFGRLDGAANLVKIVSDHRAPRDCPHIIQTKGAGTVRTAAALRADLLGLLDRFTDSSATISEAV